MTWIPEKKGMTQVVTQWVHTPTPHPSNKCGHIIVQCLLKVKHSFYKSCKITEKNEGKGSCSVERKGLVGASWTKTSLDSAFIIQICNGINEHANFSFKNRPGYFSVNKFTIKETCVALPCTSRGKKHKNLEKYPSLVSGGMNTDWHIIWLDLGVGGGTTAPLSFCEICNIW